MDNRRPIPPGTTIELRGGVHEPAAVSLNGVPSAAATLPTESNAANSTPANTASFASFTAIANLGIQAAEALHFAHERGIVHRDVKPSNLLVDDRGKLWIADFGVAQMSSEQSLTMTGDIVGTMQYLSPEQASARRGVVDHRSDIYGLGVTLYELATLQPCITGRDRAEILQRVLLEEPIPPRVFNPRIPVDLETIILKAASKEPADRYSTAADLAEDLRRFVAHRPILAKRPTTFERVMKWTWRHRRAAAAAAVAGSFFFFVTAVLVVLLVLHNAELRQITRTAQDQAYASTMALAFDRRRNQDESQADRLLDRLAPGPDEPDLRSFGWRYLKTELGSPHKSIRVSGNPLYVLRNAPDQRTLAVAGKDATVSLLRLPRFEVVAEIDTKQVEVNDIAFEVDGVRMATAGDDGSVKVWDFVTHELLLTIPANSRPVYTVGFFDSGRQLVSIAHEPVIRVWDAITGEPRGQLSNPDREIQTAFLCHDQRHLLTADRQRVVHLWDLERHQLVRTFVPSEEFGRPTTVAASRSGRFIACGSAKGRIFVGEWSTSLVMEVADFSEKIVSLSFSEDDEQLLVSDAGGVMRVLDLTALPRRLTDSPVIAAVVEDWDVEHVGRQDWVGFSGNGNVAGIVENRALYWREIDSGTGGVLDMGPHSEADIYDRSRSKQIGAFSRSGEFFFHRLDVYQRDRTIPAGWQRVGRLQGPADQIFSLCLTPDEKSVAIGNSSGGAHVFTTVGGQMQFGLDNTHSVDGGDVFMTDVLTISRDGRRCACSSHGGQFNVFDFASQQLISVCEGHGGRLLGLDFSPDGEQLVSVGEGHRDVRFWDAQTGKFLPPSIQAHMDKDTPIEAVAWSPDGRWVVSATWDRNGMVRMWDAASREHVWCTEGGADVLRFSDDGLRLMAGDHRSGRIRIWDLTICEVSPTANDANSLEETEDAHRIPVLSSWLCRQGRSCTADFYSDGGSRILASVDEDGYFRVWDWPHKPNSQILISTDGIQGKPLECAADATTDRVAVITMEGLHVYRSDGGELQPEWSVAGDDFTAVALESPTGRIVTGHLDGTVRIWSVTEPVPFAEWIVPEQHEVTEIRCVGSADHLQFVVKVENRLRLFRQDGKLVHEFEEADAYRWEVSPDGTLLATRGPQSDELLLWDLTTREILYRLPGHTGGVVQLAFSPDSSLLAASCNNREIVVWDVRRGNELRSFVGQREVSSSLAFAPDGRTLASAEGGRGILLWHVPTGMVLGEIGPPDPESLVFTPNGRHLVGIAYNRRVFSLNVTTAAE